HPGASRASHGFRDHLTSGPVAVLRPGGRQVCGPRFLQVVATAGTRHWSSRRAGPAPNRAEPDGPTITQPLAHVVCDAGRVDAVIKEYQPSDEDLVVEFSLRAWAPVFASLEKALGEELFARLHSGEGGWRGHQEASVRGALTDETMRTWVA